MPPKIAINNTKDLGYLTLDEILDACDEGTGNPETEGANIRREHEGTTAQMTANPVAKALAPAEKAEAAAAELQPPAPVEPAFAHQVFAEEAARRAKEAKAVRAAMARFAHDEGPQQPPTASSPATAMRRGLIEGFAAVRFD